MRTTRELLTEAQNAYHALLTGQAPRVVVDQNGEKVEFTPANPANLIKYIETLKAQVSNSTTGANRPMQVFF